MATRVVGLHFHTLSSGNVTVSERMKKSIWTKLLLGNFALLALGFLGAKVVDGWSRRATPERIALGRQIFEHKWEPGDSMSVEGDGLGPVFNARSCAECHFQGGVGGGGPNEFNVLSFEVLPFGERIQMVGGVVHAFATNDELTESSDNLRKLYPAIDAGPRIVDGCLVQSRAFDPVAFNTVNTPPLFGLGLIDEISDRAIQVNGINRNLHAMSRSFDGDFSTTPVGRLRTPSVGRIGKFGWKGQFATLEDFVATACAVELGLTNPLRAQDIPKSHQPDEDAKLDIDKKQLRALVCFVENLPRPEQILPTDSKARAQALRGEELFSEIGCADCHTPKMGHVAGVYSDFRLHDVDSDEGHSYGDMIPDDVEVPDGHPKPEEWKTPPLWGVADSAPYFHDGNSPTLGSAISRHDDDARNSKQRFESLLSEEREAVIAFLGTLRAPVGLEEPR